MEAAAMSRHAHKDFNDDTKFFRLPVSILARFPRRNHANARDTAAFGSQGKTVLKNGSYGIVTFAASFMTRCAMTFRSLSKLGTRERNEADERRAEAMVQEWLTSAGWTGNDLWQRPKGDPHKAEWARQLPRQTPMSRQWIANRLHMGSASYVSNERPQVTVDCEDRPFFAGVKLEEQGLVPGFLGTQRQAAAMIQLNFGKKSPAHLRVVRSANEFQNGVRRNVGDVG